MKNILLLTPFLCAASVTGTLQAQSATDEVAMRAFARDFMAAYNRQDETALQAMYTTDAVSISPEGTSTNGADRIAQLFADQFIKNDVTLLVRQVGMTWSDAQQSWVAIGTYESYGVTYVYDIPIRKKTAYRNTMVQENGQWKIARSVVTEMVKTLVHQKTGDPAAWQSALTGALHGSAVLGMNMGTPPGDPSTAYALLEWPSLDVARAFFDHPDWQKTLQQAGMGEKPVVVFLEGQ